MQGDELMNDILVLHLTDPTWYCLLSMSPISQVLMKIKNEDFVKWLRKIKTNPLKRNKNKYCEIHKDHEHNTEEYF